LNSPEIANEADCVETRRDWVKGRGFPKIIDFCLDMPNWRVVGVPAAL